MVEVSCELISLLCDGCLCEWILQLKQTGIVLSLYIHTLAPYPLPLHDS